MVFVHFVAALIPLSTWGSGLATPRRIAVVVGNNLGGPAQPRLRFARRDARRVARVLRELGAVDAEDLALLLDRDAATVREAMQAALKIQPAADLLFYYSGHADRTGLRLGSTTFPWSELRDLLRKDRPRLRVAMIDACHAGTLATVKGFAVRPTSRSSGTAILMSSAAAEVAQEVLSLRGSYFTHYLVSGLRGAADIDGDWRVTLAEAHTYATRQTIGATAGWAKSPQHPAYLFDIQGHGEVVLTDLRRASTRLSLAEEIRGNVVVAERHSSLIVAEVEKTPGKAVVLALPAGRYTVLVRQHHTIHAAEVSLPWGGTERLNRKHLTPRSYQGVASKGTMIEIHRQRLRVGVAVQSAIVEGMGVIPVLRAGYGVQLGSFELGVRGLFSATEFDTVDTSVATSIYGGGLILAYERALRLIDLRSWVVVEGHYWRQDVRKRGVEESGVFGLGVGLGIRVPIYWRVFTEIAAEGLLYLPPVEGKLQPRPVLGGGIEFGVMF